MMTHDDPMLAYVLHAPPCGKMPGRGSVSGPEKMVEVKVDQALMAERTSPGPTTPTQLKE